MRILLITQLFYPEPNHLKGLTFARELVKIGHEVEVLTGFPCYPGGKVYDGYAVKPYQRELVDGINIIRVPMYPSHDGSSWRRMANYGSLAVTSSLLGPMLTRRPDVVHVYQGPASLALTAFVYRFMLGVPYVYDIQDLWPDSLSVSGMFTNHLGISGVNRWCANAYRWASKVVVLSPGFREELCRRGVPEHKIEVIYNWCDEAQSPAVPDNDLAAKLGLAGCFNIVFAGTMGKMQAMDSILEAAALIGNRIKDIRFILVGGGVELDRLKRKAQTIGLGNTLFIPRQPISEIGHYLALADVLLIHLKQDPLLSITIPQKTQAYMAAGRPIIIGANGDAADLVLNARAGMACMPENPESLAAAIESMYRLSDAERKTMGRSGADYYGKHLSLQVGMHSFDRILRSVTTKSNV